MDLFLYGACFGWFTAGVFVVALYLSQRSRSAAPATSGPETLTVARELDDTERNRRAVRQAFKALGWTRERADQVWPRIDQSGDEAEVIARAVAAAGRRAA